jgi:probable rRNA maturation factor
VTKPNYEISITSSVGGVTALKGPIRRAVRAALQRHNVSTAVVNIALVDDATIAHLNLQYLNHKGPTDVMSFDMREGQGLPPARERSARTVDGEIVVSVETAFREAAARQTSPAYETALYALHGTLHLLGYDDKSKKGATTMRTLQDDILTSTGINTLLGPG